MWCVYHESWRVHGTRSQGLLSVNITPLHAFAEIQDLFASAKSLFRGTNKLLFRNYSTRSYLTILKNDMFFCWIQCSQQEEVRLLPSKCFCRRVFCHKDDG